LLGVIFGLVGSRRFFSRQNGFNQFLNGKTILIFVVVLQEFVCAVDKLGIDIDGLEVFHIVLVKVLLELVFVKVSVFIPVETGKGWIRLHLHLRT
jgi:hypothetical protein